MEFLTNIETDLNSYQQIVTLYNKFKDTMFENIDISISQWFSANMSASLGAVINLLQSNLNTIRFIDLDKSIESILQKNGFLPHYGNFITIKDPFNTTIPYQKLKPTDGTFFKKYVYHELLQREELPKMSVLAIEAIAEGIYEIFVNAQMHSQTEEIYTCGQFFPKKNKIEFTIVDTGIGFRNKINRHFDKQLSATQAITWAVKDRHTTKTDTPGGIGLAKLSEFIKLNAGKMQIISNNGFYEQNTSGVNVLELTGEFPGTIVNLQFRTDDNHSYILQEEIDLNNIF